MRDIKFRAWNKHTRRRSDWAELKELYNWHVFDEAVVVLMQYTGLKDKHGVEIYEGDWIRVNDGTGKVFWSQRAVCFGTWFKEGMPAEGEEFYMLDGIGRGKYECEIVGNIYENPELLEINS